MLAYRFAGERFDCGDKLGYLKATIAFGKLHPEVGSDFTEYMNGLCQSRGKVDAESGNAA